MTQLAVEKVNTYVAVLETYVGDVSVEKVNTYAAVLETYVGDVAVEKATSYVAILNAPSEGVNVEKITAYLVLLDDTTGNARQISSELRPLYQDGAIPYIDFSGDKFLTTEITQAGIYTLIFYKPDNTFLVERKYLPEGRFAIPKINFNQLYINRGRMKPSDILTIQNQMLSRLNP